MIKEKKRMTFDPDLYESRTYRNLGGEMVSWRELSDIFDFLSVNHNSLQLEVGIGTGRIFGKLAERGHTVIGVDVDRRMVSRCGQNIRSRGTNDADVHLIVADGEHLPFRQSVFDAIVCVRVLRYFRSPREGISYMCRLLVPNGRIFLEFANIRRPQALMQLSQYLRYGEFYPHLFKKKEVEGWLYLEQMTIQNVKGWHKFPAEFQALVNRRFLVRALGIFDELLQKIFPVDVLSRSFVLCAVRSG